MMLFQQHKPVHVGYEHLVVVCELALLRAVHDDATRQVGEFGCQSLGDCGIRLGLDDGLYESVVLLAVAAHK